MGETILVVIAVLALLAIAARRMTGGDRFPEPLETPELPETPEATGTAPREAAET
jgi:hypothetical protein